MASSAPVLAVVVNHNNWKDTLECLDSLRESDAPALTTMVLDNASTDGSIGHFRAWAHRNDLCVEDRGAESLFDDPPPTDAKLLIVACAQNLGFAGANNVALRYVLAGTRYEYALLLNNDATAAPGAVSAMVEADSDDRIGAIGPTVLKYHDGDVVELFAGATVNRSNGTARPLGAGMPRGATPESVDVDFICGCCVLVPRRTLERVGLMDERYFLYCEDSDWGIRMKRAGLRLVHCAGAEVWHKGGATVRHRSPLHDYYDVRARLMFVHKHYPVRLPLAFAHSATRCMYPKIVRGEWERLGATWRAVTDFVRFAVGSKERSSNGKNFIRSEARNRQ